MPFYNGTAGNDTIYGSSGNDSLLGQGGSDTLYGGAGNDNIIDNDGQQPDTSVDNLFGEAGNDTIYAGYLDNADGGSDFDTLILRLDNSPGSFSIDFTALWTGATYTIDGAIIRNFENLQWVVGTQYGDTFITGSPSGRTSQINGYGGADTLQGGAGNDLLDGDFYYRSSITNDTFNDIMVGYGGNDILTGALGDYFDGGSGTDKLGFDVGLSGAGVTISFTTLLASGSDTILGSSMFNIEDIDWVYGSQYNDSINAAYDQATTTLAGRGGDDLLSTGGGRDFLYGGSGNDAINAGGGHDDLFGEDGGDTLNGDAGNDLIEGGAGDDKIAGGSGQDYLQGGAGADKFRFFNGDTGNTTTTADQIYDFSTAQGDRIVLTAVDAIVGGADDVFTFIGSAAFNGTAGQLRYQLISGNTYVMGDTNGDGVSDLMIRLDGSVSLAASDFNL